MGKTTRKGAKTVQPKGVKRATQKEEPTKTTAVGDAVKMVAAQAAAGRGKVAKRVTVAARAARAEPPVVATGPRTLEQLRALRPKMNGARMIAEIEEARAFAEKQAQGTGGGGKRSRAQRRRATTLGRLSKHSQMVLRAHCTRDDFVPP